MSRLSWIGNVTGLILLSVISTGFVWLMSSLPRVDGRIPALGLEYPVTISRDRDGVPSVTARSEHDAYFTMGWLHAQDRLWQMELQRRVASGHLADIVGEPGLKNDRFMRTLGFYPLAEASLPLLAEETRAALQAYSDGVNAWLSDNRHRLPLEFRLLGLQPQPWKPADCLVWGRLMGFQLTANWRDEALRGQLAARLPARQLRQLWPNAGDGPVTVASNVMTSVLAALPETAAPRQASNVMVVSGKRTASGAPLLANDPHLGFQAPSLWYLLSIEAPGLRLTGAMVPGVPFHLIAHNGRIAWGTTTTEADTVDLYVENDLGDGNYQSARGPRPFRQHQEVIAVKGRSDEVLVVRETEHGPIIADLKAGQKNGQVVALRATALEPEDHTADAMYNLGRAVDWLSFTSALSNFQAPVQNFAYADTSGTIGFATAGRIPIRRKADGSSPLAGWSNAGDWTGWIPFNRLPRQLSPKNGVILNANNQVVGGKYPFQIAAYWPEGYRARRIAELLEPLDKASADDMRAIQSDSLSLAALELKELLDSPAGVSAAAGEAAAMVAKWDGTMAKDRPEPLIFNLWIDKLWTRLLEDELADDFPHFRAVRPLVLGEILTVNRHWCDDVRTEKAESCEDMVAETLEATVAELAQSHPGQTMAQWRWGDLHRARFQHPILGRVPLLRSLSNSEIATDGDDFTVNRGTFVPGRFDHIHGPGLRVVFDLADLSASTFVLATGQSGNPLSRYYRNLLEDWQANRGHVIGRVFRGGAAITLEPGY